MKKRSSSDTGSEKDDSETKYAMHALQDKLENLAFLQREHRQRLEAVEKEFSQLTQFRDDYVHLQKRLKTLPDKTSHEVMVPMGPLAFMPGHLIHTNEILVLLGDNWFAERSAKEAVEIVNRRVKDCDEKIKVAESEMVLHKSWLKETSSLFDDSKDQVEIIEELTEEEFEKSKEEHRKKVAEECEKRKQLPATEKPRDDLLSDSGASTSQDDFMRNLGEGDKKAYDTLMRRLDQLEIEEDEDVESVGSQDTEDDDRDDVRDVEIPEEFHPANVGVRAAVGGTEAVAGGTKAVAGGTKAVAGGTEAVAGGTKEEEPSAEIPAKPKKKLKRRVSWADDKRPLHTVIPDDKSESTFRIKYTTKQLSLPFMEWDSATQETLEVEENDDEAEAEAEAATAVVQSPSDIYKVFGGGRRRSSLQEPPPRGILKKTISNPESQTGAEGGWNYPHRSGENVTDSPDDIISTEPSEIPSLKDDESLEAAFSYRILERNVDPESVRPPVPASSPTEPQSRKISRFKAARMKK